MWRDSQAQLAKALSGLGETPGADPTASASAFAEMWRSGMAAGPMLSSLPGLDSTGVGASLGRMLEPLSLSLMGGNQVSEALRGMTEGPRLADVGTVERRMAQVMELYVEVQAAARGYEALVAGAWMEANQAFASNAAKSLSESGPLPPKQALKLWLGTVDEVLTRTHRSPAFLEAQRRMLRAGMDFLLAERQLVETLVEPTGLPTRSEIDELHRTVHTLKRQVRALGRPEPGGAATASKAETGAKARTKTGAKKASPRARPAASARKAKEGAEG
jgi:polyhydroxyalkanoate synthesis regulator phasin